MDSSFQPFDFHRIFFGDAPLLFLLEIVFRTCVMYAYTIFLLRLLGKRGMGQLSTLELAIIICFGSAVGDPMIGAQIPVIYGVIAITTVALLQFGMEKVINRFGKLEKMVEGKPNLLVDNGKIIAEALEKENLSHADLFRSLRSKEVHHLGEVHKAFFETSGEITVLFHAPSKVRQGLTLMPEEEMPENAIVTAPASIAEQGLYCCLNCGNCNQLTAGSKAKICKDCGCDRWLRSDKIA